MAIYFFVCYIVDQNAAIRPSVESSSQTSEFLLSGCVPNLPFLSKRTSRLITLPSTTTYFSMKSAPTVALYD